MSENPTKKTQGWKGGWKKYYSITGAVAFADQDVYNRRRPNKGRQWGLNRILLYILLTALQWLMGAKAKWAKYIICELKSNANEC